MPVSVVGTSVDFDTICQMVFVSRLFVATHLWHDATHNVCPQWGGNVQFDEASAPAACAPTAFLFLQVPCVSRRTWNTRSIIPESVEPLNVRVMTVHESAACGGQGKAVERGGMP